MVIIFQITHSQPSDVKILGNKLPGYSSKHVTRLHRNVTPQRVGNLLACEDIRFSSLFAAGDVSRGETDVFAG